MLRTILNTRIFSKSKTVLSSSVLNKIQKFYIFNKWSKESSSQEESQIDNPSSFVKPEEINIDGISLSGENIFKNRYLRLLLPRRAIPAQDRHCHILRRQPRLYRQTVRAGAAHHHNHDVSVIIIETVSVNKKT